MFKDNFRVSRSLFEKICERTKDLTRTDTNMRLCIPLAKRVAIALYALGSSAEYRTVAHLFGVGRSTVGETVLDFCHSVCKNLNGSISSYPPCPEEVQRIVEGFKDLGFPQCYGAIGTSKFRVLASYSNFKFQFASQLTIIFLLVVFYNKK